MLAQGAHGGEITSVDPGGIGAEVGIEPGDRLLSINGHPLRDVIDYRFYGEAEELDLIIERDGISHLIEIERDENESLGLAFADLTFDGMRRCVNHCPFCFVQQMPRKMRRSLYIHDDDYRYSFLFGNFVTLTNLTEEDWQRIGEQHLSPLYVSVHATEPALHRQLLGNPAAPDVLAQLQRLGDMGVRVHAQIVVTPGLNDGQALERSILDLAALYPTVQTLAIVPVGLTRFQKNDIRAFRREDARDALAIIDRLASPIRQQTDCTWLFASDELLLQAGASIPLAAFYDTDAQRENGVGLVRELLDDWDLLRETVAGQDKWPQRITLATGVLIAPTVRGLLDQLGAATGMQCDVVTVENRFFGETVTVAGLLTGQDVLDALANHDMGELVFLPRSMFEQSGCLTLDDVHIATFEEQLGRPVRLVETLSDLVHACRLHGCA